MKRVESLLPSTTEIAHALGYGDQLVGRSHECDRPSRGTFTPADAGGGWEALEG